MDEEATQQASPDREHPIGETSFSSVPEDGMLTLLSRVGMHCDWVLRRPEDGSPAVWTFGRNARAQFQFPSSLKRLSGVHFKIWATDDSPPTFMIRDVSTNGTYLNSVRIPKDRNCMLVNGDIINVGLGVASDEIKLIVSIPQQQQRGGGSHQLQGIHQHYDFGSVIGQGAFAIVRKAVVRETGKTVAVKIIEKAKLSGSVTDAVKREISILTSLRHDNIVCLHEIFEDGKQYFLVMDYVAHGDLMDALTATSNGDTKLLPKADNGNGPGFTEETCREIIRQVLKAIEYMHGMGISHRDLKPDNILINSVEPVTVKVADFGLAKLENQGTFLKTFCGTLSYLAPEVLASRNNLLGSSQQAVGRSQPSSGGYTQKVDIWSVGCLAYVILTGCMPFGGSTQEEMYRTVLAGEYHKGPLDSGNLSLEAREFLAALLDVDAMYRPEASQALKLAWLTKSSGTSYSLGSIGSVNSVPDDEKWSQPRQRIPSQIDSFQLDDASRASSMPSLEPPPARSSFVTVDNLNLQSSRPNAIDDNEADDSDQDSDETRQRYDLLASQNQRQSELDADPRNYVDGVEMSQLDQIRQIAPDGTLAILRTDSRSIPFKDICITRDSLIIGRDPKLCDVSWNSPKISRQQCKVYKVATPGMPGKYELWFENLSKSISSFVLDIVVPPLHKARVYNGDLLCIAMYALSDKSAEGLMFNLEITCDNVIDNSPRNGPVEVVPVSSPEIQPAKQSGKREASSGAPPSKRAHTLAS